MYFGYKRGAQSNCCPKVLCMYKFGENITIFQNTPILYQSSESTFLINVRYIYLTVMIINSYHFKKTLQPRIEFNQQKVVTSLGKSGTN